MTAKTTGFGTATSCELDIYINTGGGGALSWNNASASGTISGNTVTVPSVTLPGGSTVDFQPGQTAVAISCH